MIKPVLSRPQTFFIRPAPGWLDLVLEEVKGLVSRTSSKYMYGPKVYIRNNGVMLSNCDYRQCVSIVSNILCAHDVEWIIASSSCKSRKHLHKVIGNIDFSLFVDHNISHGAIVDSISLQCYANRSFVNSSSLLKELFYKHLHKYMGCERKIASQWLSREASDPSTRVRLHLERNTITCHVSMSGADMPIYKRRYKSQLCKEDMKNSESVAVAPLPEHHAAACFMWMMKECKRSSDNAVAECDINQSEERIQNKYNRIIVPFAGTGTLGFEAMLCTWGVGGGTFSTRTFSCEKFLATSDDSMLNARRVCRERVATAVGEMYNSVGPTGFATPQPVVYFSDINSRAVKTVEDNINSFASSMTDSIHRMNSGSDPMFDNMDIQLGCVKKLFDVPKVLDFLLCPVEETINPCVPIGKPLHVAVLLNPPFGTRLAKKSSALGLYRKLSLRLTEMCMYLQMIKEEKVNDVSLSGYCLCPDEQTWSVFVSHLSQHCRKVSTKHFSHGGKDMRVVAFQYNI